MAIRYLSGVDNPARATTQMRQGVNEIVSQVTTMLNPATATAATTGSATALPANPVGYAVVSIGGKQFKMPYYNL